MPGGDGAGRQGREPGVLRHPAGARPAAVRAGAVEGVRHRGARAVGRLGGLLRTGRGSSTSAAGAAVRLEDRPCGAGDAWSGSTSASSMIEQRAEDPMLVENVVGDMEALPFDDGSFDAALFVGRAPPRARPAAGAPGGSTGSCARRSGCSPPSRARSGSAGPGVAPVPGHAHEFRFSLPVPDRTDARGWVHRRPRRRQAHAPPPRPPRAAPSVALRPSAAPIGSTGRSRAVPGYTRLAELALVRATAIDRRES